MLVRISQLHNEDRLQGTLTNLARGPANPKLRIYDDSGTPQIPASITDSPTGVLLCEVTLNEPVGTIAGGVLTWAIPSDALVTVSGVAKWARFIDGNGATSLDCDVSGTSGNGAIKLSDVNLIAGGSLRVTSATFG